MVGLVPVALIGLIMVVAVALALGEDYEELICRDGKCLGYGEEYVEFVCRVWELKMYNLIRRDP